MSSGNGLEGQEVAMLAPAETLEILQAHIKAGSLSAGELEQLSKLMPSMNARPGEQEDLSLAPYAVRSISKVDDPLPTPVLAATDLKGMLLAEGEIMVLAGEGGTGKSSMVVMLALNIAAICSGYFGVMPCQFLHGLGGQVLLVSYEDRASILKRKMAFLANIYDQQDVLGDEGYVKAEAALDRVWVLGEDPQELYGQMSGMHIDTRPHALPGWYRLWSTVDKMDDLAMVIIDPALAAYTGNSNSTTHIRQFFSAIVQELKARGISVILIHHSTKDSRFVGSMDEYNEFELFDPGKLQGAAGWVDGRRGAALVLAGRGNDMRKMGIMKCSWGEEWKVIDLIPRRLDDTDPMWDGMIVSYDPQGKWRSPRKPETAGNGKPRKAGGGGFQA